MPVKRMSQKLIVGLVLITTLIVIPIAVIYAHGGDVTLIHACVKTNNGSIRIVSPSATCSNTEVALDWSITGPEGPQGSPGAPGMPGVAGATGPQGPAGPNTQKIALLKWHTASSTAHSFAVGLNPRDIAFDGDKLWVVNDGSDSVSVLRASDGALVAT